MAFSGKLERRLGWSSPRPAALAGFQIALAESRDSLAYFGIHQ